ncbi:MAG: hypothetical protein ABIH42_02885 [Planctomycetota bacterium]
MSANEDYNLLENLLQCNNFPESAELIEKLSKNSGLKNYYAKQQFIHALLRSKKEISDNEALSKQINNVMSAIEKEEHAVARLRAKRWRIFSRTAGIAAVILITFVIMMFIPGTQVEAESIMENARKKSFENVDRTYSLEISADTIRGCRTLNGFLYVRGADKSVLEIETPRGKAIRGKDGEEIWVIPARGPVFTRKHMNFIELLDPEAADLPQLSMDRVMAHKSSFNIRIVGKAELPDQPEKDILLICCTALPGTEIKQFKEAKYWVNRKSGLVVRGEILFCGFRAQQRERKITINFVNEQKRSENFYRYETHNKDNRPMFDPYKFRENNSGKDIKVSVKKIKITPERTNRKPYTRKEGVRNEKEQFLQSYKKRKGDKNEKDVCVYNDWHFNSFRICTSCTGTGK